MSSMLEQPPTLLLYPRPRMQWPHRWTPLLLATASTLQLPVISTLLRLCRPLLLLRGASGQPPAVPSATSLRTLPSQPTNASQSVELAIGALQRTTSSKIVEILFSAKTAPAPDIEDTSAKNHHLHLALPLRPQPKSAKTTTTTFPP